MLLYILGFILYAGIGVGLAMWACDLSGKKFYPIISSLFLVMIFWPVLVLGGIICVVIEYLFERK